MIVQFFIPHPTENMGHAASLFIFDPEVAGRPGIRGNQGNIFNAPAIARGNKSRICFQRLFNFAKFLWCNHRMGVRQICRRQERFGV